MRVVSTACSNTEIVCALGLEELLVGVDDHSDYPADVVAELPRVGPDLGVDVEKVVALDPDLVLASLTVPGHEDVVRTLREAGLDVLAPEPVSLDDVYRDIRLIAARVGEPARGERLALDLQERFSDELPRPRDPNGSGTPSVLVQWWPSPVIAPGRLSWVNDLIALAGGRNPLAGEDVKSRPLTIEEVVETDPDVIVLSWCGIAPDKVRTDVVTGNADFARLSAIRKQRVFRIPEAILGRPSPRLAEGYQELREVIDRVSAAA